eukprot:2521940-Heterocapsa_arctica.AAC.1
MTAAAGAGNGTGGAGVSPKVAASAKVAPPKAPAIRPKVAPPAPAAARTAGSSRDVDVHDIGWFNQTREIRSADRASNITRLSGAGDSCSQRKADVLSRLDSIINKRVRERRDEAPAGSTDD